MPQRPYDLDEETIRQFGGRRPGDPPSAPTPERRTPLGPVDLDEDTIRQFGGQRAPASSGGWMDPITDTPPEPEPQTSTTFERYVQDPLLTWTRGVHGVGAAGLGLADIATDGYAGKLVEDYTPWQPQKVDAYLKSLYSPEQQRAFENVQKAEGFLDIAEQAVSNPSVLLHGALESVPSMVAGGLIGRGIKALTGLGAWATGLGEGAIATGAAAESNRQQSEDRLLSARGAGAALGAGAGTTMFGALGQRVAKAMGIADIDTALTGAASEATKRSLARQIGYGAFQEGMLEELPQSVQEQMWSNYAADRDLMDGVPHAAVLGAVIGGMMGGGGNIYEHFNPTPPKQNDEPADMTADEYNEAHEDEDGWAAPPVAPGGAPPPPPRPPVGPPGAEPRGETPPGTLPPGVNTPTGLSYGDLRELARLGYFSDQIAEMTPEEARAILEQARNIPSRPPVGRPGDEPRGETPFGTRPKVPYADIQALAQLGYLSDQIAEMTPAEVQSVLDQARRVSSPPRGPRAPGAPPITATQPGRPLPADITFSMAQKLAKLGYYSDQIAEMSPDEAHEILTAEREARQRAKDEEDERLFMETWQAEEDERERQHEESEYGQELRLLKAKREQADAKLEDFYAEERRHKAALDAKRRQEQEAEGRARTEAEQEEEDNRLFQEEYEREQAQRDREQVLLQEAEEAAAQEQELSNQLKALYEEEKAERRRQFEADYRLRHPEAEPERQRQEAEGQRRMGDVEDEDGDVPPPGTGGTGGVPPTGSGGGPPLSLPPAAPTDAGEAVAPDAGYAVSSRSRTDLPDIVDQLHAAAKAIDPKVSRRTIETTFQQRQEQRKARVADMDPGVQGEDGGLRDLAKTIASLGGWRETDFEPGNVYWKPRPTSELKAIKDLAKQFDLGNKGNAGQFGSMAGFSGVFRDDTGLPTDVLVQSLQQFPQFEWLQTANDLHEYVTSLLTNKAQKRNQHRVETLRDLRIDPEQQWWVPAHLRAISRIAQHDRMARAVQDDDTDFDPAALDGPLPRASRGEDSLWTLKDLKRGKWQERRADGERFRDARNAEDYPQSVIDALRDDEWDYLVQYQESDPDQMNESDARYYQELTSRVREAMVEADPPDRAEPTSVDEPAGEPVEPDDEPNDAPDVEPADRSGVTFSDGAATNGWEDPGEYLEHLLERQQLRHEIVLDVQRLLAKATNDAKRKRLTEELEASVKMLEDGWEIIAETFDGVDVDALKIEVENRDETVVEDEPAEEGQPEAPAAEPPKPKLTFGKKPPSALTESDPNQPRLPGDVGDVRDVEIDTPEIPLPQQSLQLTAEDAPKEMQEKPKSLFEESAEAHANVKKAIADLMKEVGKAGSSTSMGLGELGGSLPLHIYKVVKELAKAGIVDARLAWSHIEPSLGVAAGDLLDAFKLAWRRVHGETPEIESKQPRSKSPEERAAKFAAAAQGFQAQGTVAAPKPEGPPRTAAAPAPKPAAAAAPKPAVAPAPKPAVAATPKPQGPPRTTTAAPTQKPAAPPVTAKPPVTAAPAPAAPPAAAKPPSTTGLTEMGGKMGDAISYNLYKSMFDRLQAGKLPEPFPADKQSQAAKAVKAAWDRGEIKTIEDVKRVAQAAGPATAAPAPKPAVAATPKPPGPPRTVTPAPAPAAAVTSAPVSTAAYDALKPYQKAWVDAYVAARQKNMATPDFEDYNIPNNQRAAMLAVAAEQLKAAHTAPGPKPLKPVSTTEAPTHVTEEQKATLGEYGLLVVGYGDRNGLPIVKIAGKTKDDTYERRDLFNATDSRFWKAGTPPHWQLPLKRLGDFFRGLSALSKATGEAKRRLPAHIRDASLSQLRANAAGRSDRSGFDRDISEFISPRTQGIIQRGKDIGIAQQTLDEQKEDVAILVRNAERGNRAGILASDPGTGKTFVLGGTISELVHRGNDTIIYVTKNNDLIDQVKKDIAPFAGSDKVQYMTYSKFRETPPQDVDVLIFDEAHEIKNVRAADASSQAKQAQEWLKQAKYTIIATATPYENPTQVAYLAPTGIFDEVFGDFHKFATAFGATPILIDKELGLYDYQWKRTVSSNDDQKAAREWMKKEGFFTSRKMRLPAEQTDTRLVKVTGDSEIATVFDALIKAREDNPPGGNGAMWVTNFAKRLLESSKIDVAINEAKDAIKRGRYPIIFIETKAEAILDIPHLAKNEAKYLLHVAESKRAREKPTPRKEWSKQHKLKLLPKGVMPIMQQVMQQTGQEIIHIKPAEQTIQDAFGEQNVAIYTGSVDGSVAQKNLTAWRGQGQPRVLVATMAKGGTGLSLHDKVGDHQTTQINVNLPWSPTGVVQVAQRSLRYGMVGKGEVMWLFADNVAMDQFLAKRVGRRMQDMGSLVHGEVLEGSVDLENYNFDDVIVSEEEGWRRDEKVKSPMLSYRDVQQEHAAATGGKTPGTKGGKKPKPGPGDPGYEGEMDEEPPPPKKTYNEDVPGPAEHPLTGNPVLPLGLTELFELVGEWIDLPKVVKRFRKLGVLGHLRTAGQKAGIAIHADLFKKGREQELVQVLAHEIGHLIDWLPDYVHERGNLLGRLFTLRKFMAHEFIKDDGSVVELKDIHKELIRVTELWSPYDKTTASNKYRKYRESGPELMAEALSALLSNPEFLAEHAPNFFREFFEAMDRKPEVKQAYEAMQGVMALTEEQRAARRIDRAEERIERIDQLSVEAQKARIQKIKDEKWNNWWLRLKVQYLDKHAKVGKFVKQLAAHGKPLAEHLDPSELLKDRNYVGSQIKGWMSRNVRPLVERLGANGISWTHFGLALEIDRTIQGDYEGKLGPGGRTPATAQHDMDELMGRYSPEQQAVLRQTMHRFRKGVQEVIEKGYEAGLYTKERYEEFQENPAYATFRGIDFIDERVTARIYHAKGSAQDVANAANSTILKMIVTMRETQNQLAKRAVFDMLEKNKDEFPGEIERAKRIGESKFAKPENNDLKAVGYFDFGVWQEMYVDELIADSLNNESVGRNNAVMQVVAAMNANWFRPLFVGYNPGFMMFNVLRDFFRTWKNYNNKGQQLSLRQAVKRYRESHKIARLRSFGTRPKNMTAAEAKAWDKAWSDLTAAEESFIFGLPFAQAGEHQVQETELKDILTRTQTIEGAGPPTGWRKAVPWVAKAGKWMENIGNYIETLPKTAAMLEMMSDGTKVSDLSPSQRSYLREKIGTPDIHAGGTYKAFYNELFLFSNIIMQGWRQDMNVAHRDITSRLPEKWGGSGDPTTRSGWLWKTASLNVLPKALMMAATMGLLGEALRRMFAGVSEYDKSNYIIIPWGLDEKGNTKYIRLPQDDTGRAIGGLAWKGMRGDKNLFNTLTEIVDYAGGQVPGMTPGLKAVKDTYLMAAGQNPYDSFRSRNLFTDQEMDMGSDDPGKWAKFFGWEVNQLGLSTYLGNFLTEKGPEEQTVTQRVLDAPLSTNVLGRWFRVSDYGLTEEAREIRADVRGERAKELRTERGEVDAAIREYMRAVPPPLRTKNANMGMRLGMGRKIVEKVYPDMPRREQNSKAMEIARKIGMGAVRGSSDPLVDQMVASATNREKKALAARARKSMSPAEFDGWLDRAASQGVISRELSVEIKREARP